MGALALLASCDSCGSDGGNPMTPDNHPPAVSISSPRDGSSFSAGQVITFQGSASDQEDGTLSGSHLVWRDGSEELGQGESFTRSDLAEGSHDITLEATDGGGKTGSASVSIMVAGATATQFSGSWQEVSVGEAHACGLDTEGHAFCWGTNQRGDLGAVLASSTTCTDPTSEFKLPGNTVLPCTSTPVAVSGGLLFRRITAGVDLSCGITVGGDAYCWGSNSSSALGAGLPPGDSAISPVKVFDPASGPVQWKDLRAGLLYACGISTAGDLYCWGANNVGQAGGGLNAGHLDRPLLLDRAVDTNGANAVSLRGNVLGVAVGNLASCAVFDASLHVLACWGSNGDGQLTVPGGSFFGNAGTPTYNYQGIDTLSLGESADCGLSDAKLYCWGSLYDLFGNDFAPGADLDLVAQGTPQLVDGRAMWAAVSASGTFGCALSTDGTAYCFGTEHVGELGDGVNSARAITPVPVQTTQHFVQVDASASEVATLSELEGTTCGVTDGGEIHCWGGGDFGSLGNGDDLLRNQNTPVRIVDPGSS